MAAVEYNVVADQSRDFNLSLVWYDQYGDKMDLTGYGAIAEIVSLADGTVISRIDHDDGITVYEPGDPLDADQGRIHLAFPAEDMENAPLECEYEAVVFPSSADPESNPISLIRGLMTVRRETIQELILGT